MCLATLNCIEERFRCKHTNEFAGVILQLTRYYIGGGKNGKSVFSIVYLHILECLCVFCFALLFSSAWYVGCVLSFVYAAVRSREFNNSLNSILLSAEIVSTAILHFLPSWLKRMTNSKKLNDVCYTIKDKFWQNC